MRIRLAVLATATLALAACGSSQTTSPAKPSSAEPTKESGLQEYPSAQALADDLTKHGHTCNMTPTGGSLYSVDGGKCTLDGKEIVLGIYTNQSQINANLAAVNGTFARFGLDYGWLTGKNWAINCGSRAACEKIGADLGGSVVAPVLTPPATATTP